VAEETYTSVLELEDQFSRTLKAAGSQVDDFNRKLKAVNRDVQTLGQGFREVGSRIMAFGRFSVNAIMGLVRIVEKAVLGVAALAAGITAALFAIGTKAVHEAARVEVLWSTLAIVAKNAKQNMDQVTDAVRTLEKANIATGEALEGMILWITAKLPIDKINDMAAAAKDMGAAWGVDSSELFNRFVKAISRGETMLLEVVGVTETATLAYDAFGKSVGKSAEQLTAHERQLAILNLIMQKSTGYAGAYWGAMEFAGKQATSLTRLYKTLALALGTLLMPAYRTAIKFLTDLTKGMTDALKAGGGFARLWQTMGNIVERILRITESIILRVINNISGVTDTLADSLDAMFSEANIRKAFGWLLRAVAKALDVLDMLYKAFQNIKSYIETGLFPAGQAHDFVVKILKMTEAVGLLIAAFFALSMAIAAARAIASGFMDVSAVIQALAAAMATGVAIGGVAVINKTLRDIEEATISGQVKKLEKEREELWKKMRAGEPNMVTQIVDVEEQLAELRRRIPSPEAKVTVTPNVLRTLAEQARTWAKEVETGKLEQGLGAAVSAVAGQTDATKENTGAVEQQTNATEKLANIVRQVIGGGRIAGLGIAPVEVERWRQYRSERGAGGDRIVVQVTARQYDKLSEAMQDIAMDAVTQAVKGSFRSYAYNRTGA